MINIVYHYHVVKTDNQNNHMEVEYSADGHDTVLVGMPFPLEGDNLESHFRAYAPIYHWVISKKKPQKIEVGFKGTISPPAKELPKQEVTKEDIEHLIKSLIESPPTL